ncbi:MAG: hypothetical protein ACRD0K_06655 [Egibacteraceae bacterium]
MASAQEEISATLEDGQLKVKPLENLANAVTGEAPLQAEPYQASPDKAAPAEAAPAEAAPGQEAPVAVPAGDVDDDGDPVGDQDGLAFGFSGCVLQKCFNGNASPLGEDGQIDVDGTSVAIAGDAGDGSSLIALGVGLCLPSILATTICDQVGKRNGIGGKGGAASAEAGSGDGDAVALGGIGGDGGLIAIGLGICGLGVLANVQCDDVGSNNGLGGNGGSAGAFGGSGDGTGVGAGGDGGDGGKIGVGVGICGIGILAPVVCDDVGSNNGAGGNGGLGKVLGDGGDGTGIAFGGSGGDGGFGLGVGICAIGILGPVLCEDVGSDVSRGGHGGFGAVEGFGEAGDVAVAIGGDGGDGGIGVSIGACVINLGTSEPCIDVGSNSARGGSGGKAIALPGIQIQNPVIAKPVDDKPVDDQPVDDEVKDVVVPDEEKAEDAPAKDEAKPEAALAETGRDSAPLALVALVTLILGAGLVGAARRFDRRNSAIIR